MPGEKEEEFREEKMKQIFQTCFPHPAKLKDEKDRATALAALVHFKLHQQIIGSAKQLEAAAHCSVNQKRLSEVIHRKKYLGEKRRRRRKKK